MGFFSSLFVPRTKGTNSNKTTTEWKLKEGKGQQRDNDRVERENILVLPKSELELKSFG